MLRRSAWRASRRSVAGGVVSVTMPVDWEDAGGSIRLELEYVAHPRLAASYRRELAALRRMARLAGVQPQPESPSLARFRAGVWA